MSGSSHLGAVSINVNVAAMEHAVVLHPLIRAAAAGRPVPVTWHLGDRVRLANPLATVLRIESVYNGPAPRAGTCTASADGRRETLYPHAGGPSASRLHGSVAGSFHFYWMTAAGTSTMVAGPGCYTLLLYLDDRGLSNPRMSTAVQLN